MATKREAYEAAKSAAVAADEAWRECEHGTDDLCEHRIATDAADEVVEIARAAYCASDEPRTWIIRVDGEGAGDVEAATSDEALDSIDAGAGYDDRERTIWVDLYVHCEETGEDDERTVAVDPPVPACTDDEHDWQSPIEIVGGIRENPGVWGQGGGVVIHEVCMHCGCERVTDTWARDHHGRQGLTSVTYEPGKYADEIAALEAAS